MTTIHHTVRVPHHPPTAGHYSPAVRVPLGESGSLLFISGQVAKDGTGLPAAVGDPGAQTQIIFDFITEILHEAGGDIANLVNLTLYLADISHFPAVSKIRNERLAEPLPASTVVEVTGLAKPEFLVEVTATAFLPAPRDGAEGNHRP